MLLTSAAAVAYADTAVLTPSPSRDRKVVRRFALPEEPRGIAVGSDGTVYVGLARSQAVLAIDPSTGTVKKRVVLDHEEIAATKELVTLRTDAARKRLFIANGSDESALILSLPDLGVLREITLEGEVIRDVIPDPRGRYVYVLGRRVHVFDGDGTVELRVLDIADPMAIAVSSNGSMLAVVAPEDFGNAIATSVTILDTSNFSEIARDPLQTEKRIEAVMFANRDSTLVALARDQFFEKPVTSRPARAMSAEGAGGAMRMKIDFGDLVNSSHLCLPEGSGPQVATLTSNDDIVVYAERRCSASGSFSGTNRGVMPASLYGISAYALAYDESSNTLVATDREGYLTIYRVPRPAIAK